MAVVAMTREMGSLGKDVALGVAEALGLEIVHHELVEAHLADKMEVNASAVHRFLESTPKLLERFGLDRRSLALFTADEILELAIGGNILIRGWGATRLLRKVPHVLCVRVCAPTRFRVRVLMERLGITDETIAAREIQRNDAAHRHVEAHPAQDANDAVVHGLDVTEPQHRLVRRFGHLCGAA